MELGSREHTHVRPGPISVGAARNIGLEHARGDVVCFLDDDDWYGPGYVEPMLLALSRADLANVQEFWSYCILRRLGWLGESLRRGATATMAIWRTTWRCLPPFPDTSSSEDCLFMDCARRRSLIEGTVLRPMDYVYIRHLNNGTFGDVRWERVPDGREMTEHVRAMFGSDIALYDDLSELVSKRRRHESGYALSADEAPARPAAWGFLAP